MAFEEALQPALRGEVDLVVHGGDVLYRSKVKPGLVFGAFAPLKRVADCGIPVVVVPGNHERSAIPFPLLAAHPGIHILDTTRTVSLRIREMTIAIAGFPNVRNGIATRFEDLVEATRWRSIVADIRLLAVHQTVEGARVGPAGYTFRRGPDVISGSSIPNGFAAVLAGHIHRHQVLRRDLDGQPFAAPVFYAGSTSRTSAAERDETKGCITMTVGADAACGGRVASWRFHPLDEPRSAQRFVATSQDEGATSCLSLWSSSFRAKDERATRSDTNS